MEKGCGSYSAPFLLYKSIISIPAGVYRQLLKVYFGNNILAESSDSGDDSGGQVFENFLRCLGPRGLMAAYEAFFDESERKGGTFCVAGYAFLPRQVRKFIKEWKPLFAPYGGFHMKELVHCQGRFKGISVTERNRLLVEAVRIVNSRMQFGVAVSCPIGEVMLHAQTGEVQAFKHAYPICCYLGMIAMSAMMGKMDREIFYTFEAGHPNEGDARQFVQAITSNPKLKRDFHHAGDAFLPKDKAMPLQAADLLAWHWLKFKEDTLDSNLRPMRKDLLALFMRDSKRYRIAHVQGEKLLTWLNGMPGLLREEGIIDEAGRTLQ